MGDTYASAAEAEADRAQQPTCRRIDVEVVRFGERGPIYRVAYDGGVLIKSCRCPLFESCRALLAQGITGRLELWRSGRVTYDAACDIQVGAQYTLIESETESLRLARWYPYRQNAVSRRSSEVGTAENVSQVPREGLEEMPILERDVAS